LHGKFILRYFALSNSKYMKKDGYRAAKKAHRISPRTLRNFADGSGQESPKKPDGTLSGRWGNGGYISNIAKELR